MAEYLLEIGLVTIDVVVTVALWRHRGKPLPKRLEWLREWPVTRWLCQRMESPVLVGF